MNTFRTIALSLLLFSLLAGCDDPPPPPPPPPTDAGGTDAGGADSGSTDGGVDAGTDSGTDAGAFDAGPAPMSGAFADLFITGRHTASHRLIPPANLVECRSEGTDDGYVGLSVNPSGVGSDAFEIDIFGPVTARAYAPREGAARPGQFSMLYRVTPTETYLLDTSSRPCSFEVTSLTGGVLEATFDCTGLVNFAVPGEGLNVRGQVRCDFP